jgi:hypothetical protein
MDSHKLENDLVNLHEVAQKIARIQKKVDALDYDEVNEWKSIQENKISQLARSICTERERQQPEEGPRLKVKIKALKENLRILVFICHQLNSKNSATLVLYNSNAIM